MLRLPQYQIETIGYPLWHDHRKIISLTLCEPVRIIQFAKRHLGLRHSGTSYRRSGRKILAGRKIIRCPYCGGVLAEVDKDKMVTVYRMPSKRKNVCHTRRQCLRCKGEVGILLVWGICQIIKLNMFKRCSLLMRRKNSEPLRANANRHKWWLSGTPTESENIVWNVDDLTTAVVLRIGAEPFGTHTRCRRAGVIQRLLVTGNPH